MSNRGRRQKKKKGIEFITGGITEKLRRLQGGTKRMNSNYCYTASPAETPSTKHQKHSLLRTVYDQIIAIFHRTAPEEVKMRPRLRSTCLASTLKLFNFVQAVVGISFTVYSVSMLSRWNVDESDWLPEPWFKRLFFLSSLIGYLPIRLMISSSGNSQVYRYFLGCWSSDVGDRRCWPHCCGIDPQILVMRCILGWILLSTSSYNW